MVSGDSEDAIRIDAVLATDADVYASMDEATRERYRVAVREIALWSGTPVETIARAAVELAAGDHVGHVLLGNRRSALEQRVGARPPLRERNARFWKAHALGFYLSAIFGTSTIAVVLLAHAFAANGLALWRIVILGIFSGISLLLLATRVADFVLWTLPRPRRHFPKLTSDPSLLEKYRTVVVVPVIIGNPVEIDAIVRTIEDNLAENPHEAIAWAILTDGPDALTEECAVDEAIVDAARRGVAQLNERHAAGKSPRFHLFHRRRRWNANAGLWMGWERKRGKLVEFNSLLRTDDETSFRSDLGDARAIRGSHYVVTLDADSRLTKDSVVDLVATAAHPLNVPRFAEGTNVVVSGYSLFQPGVTVRFESRGIWADLHFGFGLPDDEVFDVGRFLGKGMYDVTAFRRAVDNQIPENAVLSHDLLEGMFARAAFLPDIHLIDYEPSSVSTFVRRLHRWTRGDWQQLPWLFPKVRGADGTWHDNTLDLLQKWRIVRVELSTLPPVALVATVGVAWASDRAGPAWLWTAWLLAILAIDMLVLVPTAIIIRSLWSGHRKRAVSRALSVTRRMVGHVVMTIALVPFLAWMRADAIIRTLFRLVVSRRHLLEWTTAAHAEGSSRYGLLASFWEMRGAVILVGIIGTSIILFRPHALVAAAPLLLLWLLSPVLAWLVRRQSETTKTEANPPHAENI